MQPRFYIGSAMHHTLVREYSRSRKFCQLTNDRLVQAELALRYWKEQDNLYIWAPIPIYTERADYRCLELALIQEWQPRLNYPFICQFFHPRKGILKKPAMNTNAQFGLATLWRRSKHKFTPQVVKDILASERFQHRLELWTIIHALGSNTKARFEQSKMLRSRDGCLTLCYALRRLANNIQEPYRTLSLQAIDASIKWWQGKPAPRASALRAPWSLSPNLQRSLKQFLRPGHLQVLAYQAPCHTPSFKMVFTKHAAVLDQLCNHKQAINDWSLGTETKCCCEHWAKFKKAALNPSDPHWVLAGSYLHDLLPADLAVIAGGSLLNKVFPSKKDYQTKLKFGLQQWTKRNGLPSMPSQDISDLGQRLWQQHIQAVTCHITKSSITAFQQMFEGATFHCEDKQASSLRIYCPCLYHQAIENTFMDSSIFEPVTQDVNSQPGTFWPKRRRPSKVDDLSSHSWTPLSDQFQHPIARMIFQLIPVACPNHFASGDTYTLLDILRSAPVDASLVLINQDLAGFFTSIDQERFHGAWLMLLNFLRPHMNVADNEVFSVYPERLRIQETSSKVAHFVH